MDSLQREAEQCKDQLKHERDQRLKKQAERDAKLSEIEAFNANLIIFQSNVAAYLSSNKAESTNLETRENSALNTINHNEKEKIRLTAELAKAVNDYEQMKSFLENNVQTLETEMTFYLNENDKNLAETKEYEPKYKDLCKHYRDKCKEYEETRKTLIDAKAKKANLEQKISQIKQETLKHVESRDDLKFHLEVKREESLRKMRQQKKEKIDLENEILQTGLKLQTLKDQNNKFVEAIRNFEPEFKYMDNLSLEELDSEDKLEEEYQKLHKKLTDGWKSDDDLKELFKKQDSDLIDKLGTLLDNTLTRENKVGIVTSKLYSELGGLEQYLMRMVNLDSNKVEMVEVNQAKE
ncbi:unnamed protein product [Brachionus calyciflorus]|uniref:Uncharacterized protein n=1 Tax=Brachionus calyciflorus TaxID=104777 RepID=A0A813T5J0_9BILA|nr:unnamed protein product [Brachionus calyciflorus]